VPIRPKTITKTTKPISDSIAIVLSFSPICTEGRQHDRNRVDHNNLQQADLLVNNPTDDCSNNTGGREVIRDLREPL